jgi:hypothetical protein
MSIENIETIPLALSVKYNDVYYAIKKNMERKALLHRDMVESQTLGKENHRERDMPWFLLFS